MSGETEPVLVVPTDAHNTRLVSNVHPPHWQNPTPALSPHDSAERFTKLGVDVFLGEARFTGPETIRVAGQTLRFKRAVIATGARAVQSAVPGLAEAGCLTNGTVFSLTRCPARLAVIGGGPIGCELAQTFQRLGSQVSVLHKNAHLLDREDLDAAALVQKAFLREGVCVRLNAQITHVERAGDAKIICYEAQGKQEAIPVDEILVGAGRAPNVEGLNLEAVSVQYDPLQGVLVNDRLQTTNPRIYAVGDVCLAWKFTHAADFSARIVIQNALFLGRKKASALTMPCCTYTDPEIAHVGLYERDARDRGLAVDTYVREFMEVDRAVLVRIPFGRRTGQLTDVTGERTEESDTDLKDGRFRSSLDQTLGLLGAYYYNRTRLTPTVKKWMRRWLEWQRR